MAAHLPGLALPPVSLAGTGGEEVRLDRLGAGRTVVCVYPLTGGRPGAEQPEGWDSIPGVRGCTEACALPRPPPGPARGGRGGRVRVVESGHLLPTGDDGASASAVPEAGRVCGIPVAAFRRIELNTFTTAPSAHDRGRFRVIHRPRPTRPPPAREQRLHRHTRHTRHWGIDRPSPSAPLCADKHVLPGHKESRTPFRVRNAHTAYRRSRFRPVATDARCAGAKRRCGSRRSGRYSVSGDRLAGATAHVSRESATHPRTAVADGRFATDSVSAQVLAAAESA